MNTFATNLKRLRNLNHLSQDQLSEKLGISRSTIGMYEQGRREPDLDTLEMIAEFFHVDIMYLLGHSSVVEQLAGRPEGDGADIALMVKPDELELLETYRLASNDTRTAILRVLGLK